METRTEEIFLKKAELLLEIIEVVGAHGIEHNIATILITRSEKKTSQDSEWNGFFNELKRHIHLKSDVVQGKVEKASHKVQVCVEERNKETIEAIKSLERRIE